MTGRKSPASQTVGHLPLRRVHRGGQIGSEPDIIAHSIRCKGSAKPNPNRGFVPSALFTHEFASFGIRACQPCMKLRMKLQNKPDETKRTTQVRLFLSLTAVMSVQLVSAANGTGLGGPPRPSESFRAIELSSCKL